MTWARFRWWLAGIICPEMRRMANKEVMVRLSEAMRETLIREVSEYSGITDAVKGKPHTQDTATGASMRNRLGNLVGGNQAAPPLEEESP